MHVFMSLMKSLTETRANAEFRFPNEALSTGADAVLATSKAVFQSESLECAPDVEHALTFHATVYDPA